MGCAEVQPGGEDSMRESLAASRWLLAKAVAADLRRWRKTLPLINTDNTDLHGSKRNFKFCDFQIVIFDCKSVQSVFIRGEI
jgi:hypothetical protein